MLRRAFSLIELMVVIAIVALLAAVAVPAYKEYVLKARVMNWVQVLNSIQTKVLEYHQKNDAWPANAQEMGINDPNGVDTTFNVIGTVNQEYIRDIRILNNRPTSLSGQTIIILNSTPESIDGTGNLLQLIYHPTYDASSNVYTWACYYTSLSAGNGLYVYAPNDCVAEP